LLTVKQQKYALCIMEGMGQKEAALAAGYPAATIYNSLNSLNSSVQVARRLESLRKAKGGTIANKEDRETLWTSIMNDTSYAVGMRLEASKLLGKAQGDFVIAKEVKLTNVNPVVMIPGNTPSEWEQHWENSNE
jgi:hypothetical protein